jgi:putative membrane protein
LLFRREVNLTYARIQDIHLRSGIIQRWLGLANLEVQTASGSANAELVVEGFKEFEAIRDFLYTRMRGYQTRGVAVGAHRESLDAVAASAHQPSEFVPLLLSIRDELRRTRELIESRAATSATPPSARNV